MNVQQAKNIPLQDLLTRLGHQPHHERKRELWYCSPFRTETVPSFKVNIERNVWYDFGEGQGGNILDFVMRHESLATIPEALEVLDRHFGRPSLFDTLPQRPRLVASNPAPAAPLETKAGDASVKILHHRALLNYLASRGISGEVARSFVDEIHYTENGKAYFALAFKNDSGGFELRNPYFKGCRGKKDVTYMTSLDPVAPMAVFEGFIDFLSAVASNTLGRPLPPVLVLNSNSMREQAVGIIRKSGVAAVDLYLDRDKSGQELAEYFRQELKFVEVVDRSQLYDGYKDFNDYLVSTRQRAASR